MARCRSSALKVPCLSRGSVQDFPGKSSLTDRMHCVVTAGPTYESLDGVRRLTNFSTGRLGSELVNFLAERGHEATLLLGQQATFRGARHAHRVETLTTTADWRD